MRVEEIEKCQKLLYGAMLVVRNFVPALSSNSFLPTERI